MLSRIKKSSVRNFSAWHVYAVVGLASLSVVWSLLNWSRIAAIQNEAHTFARYGLWVIFFEACFVIGALCMSVAVGNELPKYHPLHWLKHIRQLRKDVKDIARRSIGTKLFGIGFWLNFLGAIGTSLIVIVAIINNLPYESWGIIAILIVDIIATFSWRIPLQLLRIKDKQ